VYCSYVALYVNRLILINFLSATAVPAGTAESAC